MAKAKLDLSALKQTHGALAAPRSIEELTGQVDSYSVDTLDEYRSFLAALSDDEMQIHAVEVAHVTPVGVRSLLIDRLEAKFISGTRRAFPVNTPPKISKKNQEFQRKFLEGQL